MLMSGFPALDQLTGGFSERKGYLLYGDAREAATVLALSFLARGGDTGRPVALVTERNPDRLVEEARRYGLDLSDRLDAGSLLLFEYPANVAAASRDLSDDSSIIREFQALVGRHGIDRLVLDPVTPLLMAPSADAAAHRFQRMASSFAGLGATTIYVLDGPGGAEYVSACRDAAEGVMRLEPLGSNAGKIVFERWPKGFSTHELEFGVMPGIGLVAAHGQPMSLHAMERAVRPFTERRSTISLPHLAASPEASFETLSKPRILLMHPDHAQRATLAAALKQHYLVDEAQGTIDGLTNLSSGTPDLLVLGHEMRGVRGDAIVHKLRQSGHNLPIILIGNRIRRLSDQTALLKAGADLCLEYPIDPQLLNLHIDNFLRRIGRLKDPLNRDLDAERPAPKQGINCTTELELFCERAAEEVKFSLTQGWPVPILAMCNESGKPMLEELSSAVLFVTRSTDLVYVGSRGIAVLLPEALSVEPFLTRFAKSWPHAEPVIEQPRVTADQPDLREYLMDFIEGLAGSGISSADRRTTMRTVSGVKGNV